MSRVRPVLHNKSASLNSIVESVKNGSVTAEKSITVLEKQIPAPLRATLTSQLHKKRNTVIRTPFPRRNHAQVHKPWNSISIPDEASVLLAEKRYQQAQFHESLCQQVALKAQLQHEVLTREQEWEQSMVSKWHQQQVEAKRTALDCKLRSKQERLAMERKVEQEHLQKALKAEADKAADRRSMHALALRNYIDTQKQCDARQRLQTALQVDLRAHQDRKERWWKEQQQEVANDRQRQLQLLLQLEEDELARDRKHRFASQDLSLCSPCVQSPNSRKQGFIKRKLTEKLSSQQMYKAVLEQQMQERHQRSKADYDISRQPSLFDIKSSLVR